MTTRTNNITDPVVKLKMIIQLLATTVEDDVRNSYVDESLFHQMADYYYRRFQNLSNQTRDRGQ